MMVRAGILCRLAVKHLRTSPGWQLRGICSHVVIADEVREALASRKPVVALESTILTHGMPSPDNLRMARSVESIIRKEGAVPATIALVSGKAYVGLSDEVLQLLSDTETNNAVKVSRRDLAYTLNKGLLGGTTISATMFLAHKAGIKIFVSGGLGGVHRGAEVTMDVSADLTELGRTPVALITSGVKSILDIGKTLEYLETQGICVATYGDTKQFPAFFTSDSGYQSVCNVPSAREAAELVHTTLTLGLQNGLLIANPISPEYELEGQAIESSIQQAHTESVAMGMRSKEITPYILGRVNELSKGQSLRANIGLVENNARVGAQIAVQLSEIEQNDGGGNTERLAIRKRGQSALKSDTQQHPGTKSRPTVIGGCNLDCLLHATEDELVFSGQTNKATSTLLCGGVGRNLSDGLTRVGLNPVFLTALGDDLHGDKIREWSDHMDWSLARHIGDCSTAYYTVVLNRKGDVALGVGDMQIHERITPEYVMEHEERIQHSPMILMDGNLSVDTMKAVGSLASRHDIPVFYEPTDTDKASKPFRADIQNSVTFMKPNLSEFIEIYQSATGKRLDELDQASSTFMSELSDRCIELCQHIPNILVTLGARGVLLCMRCPDWQHQDSLNSHNLFNAVTIKKREEVLCVHMSARPITEVLSVSGAGDCMAVGFVYGQLEGLDAVKSLYLGTIGASLSLQSYLTVPSSIRQLSGHLCQLV